MSSFRRRASTSRPRRPRLRRRGSLESAIWRNSSKTNRGTNREPSKKPVMLTSAMRPSIMALVSTRMLPFLVEGRWLSELAGGSGAGENASHVPLSLRSQPEADSSQDNADQDGHGPARPAVYGVQRDRHQ